MPGALLDPYTTSCWISAQLVIKRNWVIYCSGIAIHKVDVAVIRSLWSASGGSEISGIAEKGAGCSSLPVLGAGKDPWPNLGFALSPPLQIPFSRHLNQNVEVFIINELRAIKT